MFAAPLHVLSKKNSTGKWSVDQVTGWILLLLCLPACWPMLVLQRPSAIDGTLHLLRLVLLDSHLRQGTLYPRWIPELVHGFGYPVLHFYGPASYYAAEILHLLGLSHDLALCTLFGILIVLSGFGAYQLALDLFSEQSSELRHWAALLIAVAYVYAPYLQINVYLRGALGEATAQMLVPWIFWSFRRLFLVGPRYLQASALLLALLACSHTITLIFLPPLLAIYLLCATFFMEFPTEARNDLTSTRYWGVSRILVNPRFYRLSLAILACILGAGLSAFFWLPVLVDRSALSRFAFEMAKYGMSDASWAWDTFLDPALQYTYRIKHPYQLGLVQGLCAVAGYFAARRSDWEWRFWAIVTVAVSLFISHLCLQIWESWDILLSAQFPYRLLTILSLPLALFTGHLVLFASRHLVLTGAPARFPLVGIFTVLLCLGVIWFNHIPISTIPALSLNDPNQNLDISTVAQFELDSNGIGTSSVREFLPKWAVEPKQIANISLDKNNVVTEAQPSIDLAKGAPLQLQGTITTSGPLTLRFATYFFPGWELSINDKPATIYPDPQFGLIATDLSSGSNRFQLEWVGTSSQRWGDIITIASLLLLLGVGLAIWYFESGWKGRWLVVVPIVAITIVSWGKVQQPVSDSIQPPAKSLELPGLQLLGYRTEVRLGDKLHIYPYWYTASPMPPLLVTWSLVDQKGKTISQIEADPIFNSLEFNHFPVGAVIDDSYLLPLPPNLMAGMYRLELQMREREGDHNPLSPKIEIGAVQLPETVSAPALPGNFQSLPLQFTGNIDLEGYTSKVESRQPQHATYPTLAVGEKLDYSLYWRARGSILTNYHSFVHLLNHQGQAVIMVDTLPGAISDFPRLWSPFQSIVDSHELSIPDGLTSGLYTPVLGLYDHEHALNRNSILDASGNVLGDSYPLPMIKVLNSVTSQPEYPMSVSLADMATLQGYSLTPEQTTVHTGDTFTITLFYQATSTGTKDFTRFVQLYDPASGMAGQSDAPPQDGANPTSAWVAGERIMDSVVLHIAEVAPAHSYQLLFGMYDKDGVRVALTDNINQPITDNAVLLRIIEVKP
ncbi:MAG: hypothetical protein U0175_16795 [Caldilineaceae bacterium]